MWPADACDGGTVSVDGFRGLGSVRRGERLAWPSRKACWVRVHQWEKAREWRIWTVGGGTDRDSFRVAEGLGLPASSLLHLCKQREGHRPTTHTPHADGSPSQPWKLAMGQIAVLPLSSLPPGLAPAEESKKEADLVREGRRIAISDASSVCVWLVVGCAVSVS